jgi:large subunit ribosomal protein L23
MSDMSNNNKQSGGNEDLIATWVDHTLFDEIKQLSTTKKALWSLEDRRYTFLVSPLLTKTLIKLAIEQFFNVRVLKVNTCNLVTKKKRVGASIGSKPKLKKAIVTLNPNDEIPLFSDI